MERKSHTESAWEWVGFSDELFDKCVEDLIPVFPKWLQVYPMQGTWINFYNKKDKGLYFDDVEVLPQTTTVVIPIYVKWHYNLPEKMDLNSAHLSFSVLKKMPDQATPTWEIQQFDGLRIDDVIVDKWPEEIRDLMLKRLKYRWKPNKITIGGVHSFNCNTL